MVLATTMSLYTLMTTEYLYTEADTAVCYLSHHDWVHRLGDNARLFALLQFDDGSTHMAAVEQVHPQQIPSDVDRPIFVPLWMIPTSQPLGEPLEVEFYTENAFPAATRLVLKPLDSAFYNTDVKEMLTGALTRLGVVEKGKTVMLRLEELGGFEMGFYISEVEPANVVLLNADEVVVEFEEAADQWDGRPPAPPPAVDDTPMVTPAAEEVKPQGTVLGGGPVRRLPDGRAWNPYR